MSPDGMDSRKPIPARVPAGMTSYCPWLDAFWKFWVETNHTKVCAHGGPWHAEPGAAAERIAASMIVAEAPWLTVCALEPTIFEKFVKFGYVLCSLALGAFLQLA